jgi:hypothetical protein
MADKTILEGLHREVSVEAGTQVSVRPLGVLHTFNYPYDDRLRYLINSCYLLIYQGGNILPGDDMAGSQVGWFDLD